jgi:uncharacterized membrane protein YfcA
VSRLAPVALGLSAGFLGGLFGVGGGLLMVPGMVLLMGVAQHRAHATSVAAIVAASTAAVTPLALEGEVHWETAGLLLVGAMVGAYLGAGIIDRISPLWLARAFVVLVIAAAVRMALAGDGSDDTAAAAEMTLVGAAGWITIGLGAGTLAAMLGIGGGIVFVPSLATLFSFPQHEAQATSLAVIAPTTLVAAVVHARAGRVDWPLALSLGLGGILGGALGAMAALALDAPILRRMFAVFLVAVAFRMLAETRRRSSPVAGNAA